MGRGRRHHPLPHTLGKVLRRQMVAATGQGLTFVHLDQTFAVHGMAVAVSPCTSLILRDAMYPWLYL